MKPRTNRRPGGYLPETHFWQSPLGIPPQGALREEITPLVEQAFLEALGALAWRIFDEHWNANKPAFAELNEQPPDGLAALARFCAGRFLKRLPKEGITQTELWDEFELYMARMDHRCEEDEAFTDYLKDRIGKPGWQDFQRRVVQTLGTLESPEFKHRFIFCAFWDIYPLPLKFWADAAAAELLTSTGFNTNRDKVRNFRKGFRLHQSFPTVMKLYERLPSLNAGQQGRLEIGIDELAVKQHGLTATVRAFRRFMKIPMSSES